MSDTAQGAEGADTMTAEETVTILYENYRGETAVRRIIIGSPHLNLLTFWIGSSEWHPERQWLFSAYDIEKQAYRDFAFAGIKAWGQAAVDAALASPRADSDERAAGGWRKVMRDLIAEHDKHACLHEETHRGGAIWTICDHCGRKWADDEGGFQPYEEPAAVTAAWALLKCEDVTPAQPAGAVPDSLRALSEAATKGDAWAVGDDEKGLCVVRDGNLEEVGEALPWDAKFLMAAAEWVRTLLASHPAGQSAEPRSPFLGGYLHDRYNSGPRPQGVVCDPAGQSAGSGAELDTRLKAAGMFTVAEMMGETPLTRWTVHAAMKSLDDFEWWIDAQARQYLTMRAAYEIGDKDKADELYEWVLAHVGAYQTIRANFKAAFAAGKPAPDSTRTGQGEGHAQLVRDLMGFHDALDGGVGNGAITIRCENETEQTRRNFRAVLREAAAALAARPAAPEAQGAEISQAARDVLAERRRQVEAEGWTPAHDDGHSLGELGLAAALYALPYDARVGGEPLIEQDHHIGLDMALEIACGWRLKPDTDPRRRLVKSGALILAEIERRDRLPAPPASSGQEG